MLNRPPLRWAFGRFPWVSVMKFGGPGWNRPKMTEAEAKAVKGPKPVPTADTWVMRNPEGQMVAVKVVDMTDQHLFRWIRYFRQKYRADGALLPDATDAQVDRAIYLTMTTAPAIYKEAEKRGVYVPPPTSLPLTMVPDPKVTRPASAPDAPRGYRRITLSDDE